jgi:hypothetical protein
VRVCRDDDVEFTSNYVIFEILYIYIRVSYFIESETNLVCD